MALCRSNVKHNGPKTHDPDTGGNTNWIIVAKWRLKTQLHAWLMLQTFTCLAPFLRLLAPPPPPAVKQTFLCIIKVGFVMTNDERRRNLWTTIFTCEHLSKVIKHTSELSFDHLCACSCQCFGSIFAPRLPCGASQIVEPTRQREGCYVKCLTVRTKLDWQIFTKKS